MSDPLPTLTAANMLLMVLHLLSIEQYAEGSGLDDPEHGGARYYAFHAFTRYGLYEDVRRDLGMTVDA